MKRKGGLNLDLNVKVSRPRDQGLLRLNVFYFWFLYQRLYEEKKVLSSRKETFKQRKSPLFVLGFFFFFLSQELFAVSRYLWMNMVFFRTS